MSYLCLVHWDYHNQGAHPETSNRSASIKVAQILRTRLQAASEAEYNGPNHDGQSPSQPIRNRPSEERAEEASACEDGDNSTPGQRSVIEYRM